MDFMRALKLLRGSNNPMQVVMDMAKINPQFGNFMNMVNGKTPAEIEQMVYTEAQKQGVDVNQLASRLGLKLPR